MILEKMKLLVVFIVMVQVVIAIQMNDISQVEPIDVKIAVKNNRIHLTTRAFVKNVEEKVA